MTIFGLLDDYICDEQIQIPTITIIDLEKNTDVDLPKPKNTYDNFSIPEEIKPFKDVLESTTRYLPAGSMSLSQKPSATVIESPPIAPPPPRTSMAVSSTQSQPPKSLQVPEFSLGESVATQSQLRTARSKLFNESTKC